MSYINSNNPVYISYSWANDNNPDIEKDVEILCNMMRDNDILFLQDKGKDDHSLIEYRKRIKDSEEQIGNGNAIVIFFSKKYFMSLHCLYELHCIMAKKDFESRVFPIILPDFPNIFKDIIYNACKDNLAKRYSLVYEKYLDDVKLTDVEQSIIDNEGYIEDFERLRIFLGNYKTTVTEDKYGVVISQIKEHIQNCISNTCPLTKPSVVDMNLIESVIDSKLESKLANKLDSSMIRFYKSVEEMAADNNIPENALCIIF